MTELDIDQLADWLEDDNRHEDCFDIHGLHGYLTALVLVSEPLNDDWLNSAMGQPLTELDPTEAQFIADACVALHQLIAEELYSDDAVGLTFEPTSDYEDSDMEAWCQGFMEVVFELPEQWHHDDEEQLSLMLLPIEVGSGLFVEEPEMAQFYKNKTLLKQMFDQIPEVLTDIYLLFHAPRK